MLSTGYRRIALSAAAVKRVVVATVSSAATGNCPPGGQRGIAKGTVTTALPKSVDDGKWPKGQGGGDREGPATQRRLAQRAPPHRDNSTETSSSATGSSVTEMPIASPRQTSPNHGNPFHTLGLTDLMKCDLYYQLIQKHMVKLPKWMEDVVSACSIQDRNSCYFFSDPYGGKLVQFAEQGSPMPTYQSPTNVNFLLYNHSNSTISPLCLTILSLNFSRVQNWALTVVTDQTQNDRSDSGIYNVCFRNCQECHPTDFPKLVCTLNPTQDAFTVTQTLHGQEYRLVMMPVQYTPGGRQSVIKAVKHPPNSPLPASLKAAQLTFRCPIQFCSAE